MTEQELRTLTAAIILGGRGAERNSTQRDIMVKKAVLTTNTLFEGLKDLALLEKRIAEWSNKKRTAGPPQNVGWYPKDRYPPAE